MDTPIHPDFIPHAYALILLRQDGYPCVFYGDLYGIKGRYPRAPTCFGKLPDLILARKIYAYGEQVDYFDRRDCVGWVRKGISAHPGRRSGMAVVMSWSVRSSELEIADESTSTQPMSRPLYFLRRLTSSLVASLDSPQATQSRTMAPDGASESQQLSKRMHVGKGQAGEVWRDLLGWELADVTIDQEGYGVFPCQKDSLAVFVNRGAEDRDQFPVQFDSSIYG